MIAALSANTQAILLLTAPFVAGKHSSGAEPLTPGEYNRLARLLRDRGQEPGDLLGADAPALIEACKTELDSDRLNRLLERGFLLSQSVERWQARGIWVVSRADAEYPVRLKARLKEAAPPVLYGCGERNLLDCGGLAVVGSRQVDAELLEYAENIGRLAADARRAVVSGGARGIDQAAMRGALLAGGKSVGFLADSLERAALARDHREFIMDERLVLVSACDPAAGFNVGNAMQRNKAIYALADAALVVHSELEKGGTWAGAVEQLKKLKFVPVYLRSTGERGKGMEALGRLGARPWTNPADPESFESALSAPANGSKAETEQTELTLVADGESGEGAARPAEQSRGDVRRKPERAAGEAAHAEDPFAAARRTLGQLRLPKTEAEVALELHISKKKAKDWLQRLVEEDVLEKSGRPARYVASSRRQATLFGVSDANPN